MYQNWDFWSEKNHLANLLQWVYFQFQATSKQQLSMNWKFHIPDLKVGTLDQLVGLSDDLGNNITEQILGSKF
jgi:hypothetical protein